MSEQQEPNITDPREAKAELLRWLDAGGFADYGFAVATVRRIIAERDAARALLKRAPQLYLDGQNLERNREDGDDAEADESEARALGLIHEIHVHLSGGPNVN